MKIKVCGNASLSNFREALTLRPDYAGFIFHPASKRYIGDNATLMRSLAGINETQKTGVFVNASTDEILKHAETCRLDFLQLHGHESPEQCRRLAAFLPVIKAFPIGDTFDFSMLHAYEDDCSFFLFDTPTPEFGGSGKTFDWTFLNRYSLATPFFLSGGIGPGHVAAIRQLSHPALTGVDVNSRFETAPGIKNIDELKTFFYDIRH